MRSTLLREERNGRTEKGAKKLYGLERCKLRSLLHAVDGTVDWYSLHSIPAVGAGGRSRLTRRGYAAAATTGSEWPEKLILTGQPSSSAHRQSPNKLKTFTC